MIQRHFTIKEEQDEKLEQLSEKTGASKSWHVRKALEQYFKNEE